MAIVSGESGSVGEELWYARLGNAPFLVTLLLPLVVGIVIVIKCMLNHCCVRKSTTKEELFGVAGRMTILTNTETQLNSSNSAPGSINATSSNNNNIRPSSSISLGSHDLKKQAFHQHHSGVGTSTSIDSVDGNEIFCETVVDLTDSLRAAAVKRQLPDPPQSPSHLPRRSSSMLSHDGTSDLYATVEEVPGFTNNTSTDKREHLYAKVIKTKNGKPGSVKLHGGQGTSNKNNSGEPNPSSDSETYATSLTNLHHPYAKLKRPITSEHPYAKVGAGSSGRIRTESTETAGDDAEETDTDNYDVAHPYAQINRRAKNRNQGNSTENERINGQQQDHIQSTDGNNDVASSEHNSSTAGTSSQANQLHRAPDTEVNTGDSAPVPPRRIGRQWRRSSNPQPQPNATDNTTNQATLSGDSQDSRGYSHLSVREPLSTIKAQIRNPSDPNYAFMSDDSEEMYAAIDDPTDANYMSIDRPSWLGPTSLVSPIPERREANSPLPPPPLLSPLTTSDSPLAASSSAVSSSGPAIYAQVIKRKKDKSPNSPTGDANNKSNPQVGTEAPSTSTHSLKPRHLEKFDVNSTAQSTNMESEPRRWSKADISYSEFEVVRESMFPTPGCSSQIVSVKKKGGPEVMKVAKYITPQAIVDEDNYNVIPEPRTTQVPRYNEERHSVSRRRQMSEDMYQEIDEFSLDNKTKHPYHEIPHRTSSTSDDHYHEIGSNRRRKRNKSNEKKVENYAPHERIARKNTEGEDSDDEDEDDFYEKVKSKPRNEDNQFKPNNISTNIDKKHGYEKLKKKPVEGAQAVMIGSDDDDDGSGFYESIKYPYAKLQGLQEDKGTALLYEGKPLNVQKNDSENLQLHNSDKSIEGATAAIPNQHGEERSLSPQGDLEQLYARVDKTKKKRKDEYLMAVETNHQIKAFGNNSKSEEIPKAQGSSSCSRSTAQILTKDVTIEYI